MLGLVIQYLAQDEVDHLECVGLGAEMGICLPWALPRVQGLILSAQALAHCLEEEGVMCKIRTMMNLCLPER